MVDSEIDRSNKTGNLKDLILEDDVEIIPEPESQKNLPKFTKISKKCFTYNRKCHPSIIAFTKHSAALKNWFSTVFGIDGKSIKKGVEVSNEDANNIIQYMLKKKVGEEINAISEVTSLELGKSYLKIQYPDELHKVLNISLHSMFSLTGDIKDGWITDEIFEIWHDSLNLFNGYERDVTTSFPDKFVMGGLPFSSLYKCASIKGFFDKETIDLKSTEFTSELNSKVLRGIFASPLGNLLQNYKKSNKSLRYIYSYLNTDQSHFIVIVVDLLERKVFTINPLQEHVKDNQKLAAKWIAKLLSIITYYIDIDVMEIEGKSLYNGSADMINTIRKDNEVVSFQYVDLSTKTKYPTQQDNFNCGLYCMWYYVLHMFGIKEDTDFDPSLFRRQLLFYIVGLCRYIEKDRLRNYTFPDNFTTMDQLLFKWKWSGSQTWFKQILQRHKENSLPNSFYQTSGIEEWSNDVQEKMKNKNNYYFRQKLKKLVMHSNLFSKPLVDLSKDQLSVQVGLYRNFKNNKKLAKTIGDVLKKRFTDTTDHQGIDYVLSKKATMILTIEKTLDTQMKEDDIISLATFAPLYDSTAMIGMVIDYIATTETEAKYILPLFQYTLFTGKGLGKLLINLIQVLAHVISNKDTSNVLLKCNDELETFYTEIGFKPATVNNKMFPYLFGKSCSRSK